MLPVYDENGKVVAEISREEIDKYGVGEDVRLQISENVVRAITGTIRPGQYSLAPEIEDVRIGRPHIPRGARGWKDSNG